MNNISEIKYPDVIAKLTNRNGNIIAIIAIVREALKKAHIDPEKVKEFVSEVMNSGSYEDALDVCMNWVTVE